MKSIPELYVDLSSIAKGYGVDVVAEYLQSQHVQNYMVDIGGEVRTRGRNGEQKPWRIAIERPTAGAQQQAQLVIQPGRCRSPPRVTIATTSSRTGCAIRTPSIRSPAGRSTTAGVDHRAEPDLYDRRRPVHRPERDGAGARPALANLLGIPVFMIVKPPTGLRSVIRTRSNPT